MATPAEPLEPRLLRFLDEQLQTTEIAADAEVVEVPPQPSRERGVLQLDRPVPMASTPVRNGLNRPSQPHTPSLAPHHPPPHPGSPHIEGEPENLEGAWTFSPPADVPLVERRDGGSPRALQAAAVSFRQACMRGTIAAE